MKKRILYLLLAVAGFWQIACKKSSGGTPLITGVRVVDPTKKDSLFVQGYPGNLIVINGTNLNDAQAVFFNDTSAFFNPVYNTSTHLIISIPATTQTAATLSKVPNLIKVVTSHGTANFTFTIVEPPPYITSIAFDNSGTMVFINGGNFEGVNKITFPGGDTALGYTVNKTYTQISALIPSGSGITDSLRVFVHYGVASFPFPPPMTITGISNENGAPGDTITITGTNFVVINKVIFPGGISGTNLHVINVNQLTVVVPPGITTSDTLRINGVLGTVAGSQLYDSYVTHPSPGYLSTFDGNGAGDNTGFVNWTGGYAPAPATAYPGASGAVAFLTNAGAIAPNSSVGNQGNPGTIQLNDVPWVSNTGTSIAGYYLKFEVYVAKPWSAGAIWIMVGDWYGPNGDWRKWTARFAPWSTDPSGVYQPHGWTTVTMPLTSFIGGNPFYNTTWNATGSPASLFSDFAQTSLAFSIVNDQASPAVPANGINIAIDNVRIVKGK